MAEVLEIDGARGEGGGQILRTSLTLSMATGTPIRVINVRANRGKPGLLAQHLTCIRAAETICEGTSNDVRLRARKFTFTPGKVRGQEALFSIGTAGSVGLVLQTVLPVLISANEPSLLTLCGGTHNSAAPSADFLERVFLPELNRAGASIDYQLTRYGFYPAGGGSCRVAIEPAAPLAPIELTKPVDWQVSKVTAVVSRLPLSVADRELDTVRNELGLDADVCESVSTENSSGPGNVLTIELSSGLRREVVVGFGQKGTPAEQVAREAAQEARELLESRAPVCPHLADQLILPMALGAGGRFLTTKPTLHTTTNIETVKLFLDRKIQIERRDDGLYEIAIAPAPNHPTR